MRQSGSYPVELERPPDLDLGASTNNDLQELQERDQVQAVGNSDWTRSSGVI